MAQSPAKTQSSSEVATDLQRRWRTQALAGVLGAVLLIGAVSAYLRSQPVSPDPELTPAPSAVITDRPTPDPTLTPSSAATPTPSATPTPTATPTTQGSAEAAALYQAGQYDAAAAAYKKLIAAGGTGAQLATFYNQMGNAYREGSHREEALAAYDGAIAAASTQGDAYLNKAVLLWTMERKTEAKAALELGIERKATRLAELQSTLDVYTYFQ